MRKLKSVIIALLALAFILWVYDHYLRPGSVDIRLVSKEEGKIVYCRYCGKELSREVQLVRVSPAEAPKHYVTREPAWCQECWAQRQP